VVENINDTEKYFRYAYEASLDKNDYTADKSIAEIISEGMASIMEDKEAYVYSVIPELKR
jgi:hypothetical protein